MSEDYFEKYPEGGIGDPMWMTRYSLYHAIKTAPLNVLSGVYHMLDYLSEGEEDDDYVDAETAVDILVRYALAGWHPRDLSEAEVAQMQGREDRTVDPHRYSPEEIDEEIRRLFDKSAEEE